MANPLNNVTLVGRLSQEIHEFPQNADGSVTLAMTLAVDDNYVSGPDRKAKTNFVSTRIFVPASVRANGGNGSWDRVHKGDLIAVNARLSQKPYTNRTTGETVYPDAPTVEIDGYPQFLESKQTVEARAARAVAAAPAAPAAPAQVAETPEQQIARLQAELAAAQGGSYSTDSPFGA